MCKEEYNYLRYSLIQNLFHSIHMLTITNKHSRVNKRQHVMLMTGRVFFMFLGNSDTKCHKTLKLQVFVPSKARFALLWLRSVCRVARSFQ